MTLPRAHREALDLAVSEHACDRCGEPWAALNGNRRNDARWLMHANRRCKPALRATDAQRKVG